MPVLTEPLRGVRCDISLHAFFVIRHLLNIKNKKILAWLSKLCDNKVVALGTKACYTLEGPLTNLALTSL